MPSPEYTQEEKMAGLIAFEKRFQALRSEERSSRAPAELLYHHIGQALQMALTRANARIAELEKKVGQ